MGRHYRKNKIAGVDVPIKGNITFYECTNPTIKTMDECFVEYSDCKQIAKVMLLFEKAGISRFRRKDGKITKKVFPNEYKIVKKDLELLLPSTVSLNRPKDSYIDESGDQVYVHYYAWERRPVYVLEIKSLSPSYQYSKRLMYLDKETHNCQYEEMYAQNGSLWRVWFKDYFCDPRNGRYDENLLQIFDVRNVHRTIVTFDGEENVAWMGTEYQDIRFVTRIGK